MLTTNEITELLQMIDIALELNNSLSIELKDVYAEEYTKLLNYWLLCMRELASRQKTEAL